MAVFPRFAQRYLLIIRKDLSSVATIVETPHMVSLTGYYGVTPYVDGQVFLLTHPTCV